MNLCDTSLRDDEIGVLNKNIVSYKQTHNIVSPLTHVSKCIIFNSIHKMCVCVYEFFFRYYEVKVIDICTAHSLSGYACF